MGNLRLNPAAAKVFVSFKTTSSDKGYTELSNPIANHG